MQRLNMGVFIIRLLANHPMRTVVGRMPLEVGVERIDLGTGVESILVLFAIQHSTPSAMPSEGKESTHLHMLESVFVFFLYWRIFRLCESISSPREQRPYEAGPWRRLPSLDALIERGPTTKIERWRAALKGGVACTRPCGRQAIRCGIKGRVLCWSMVASRPRRVLSTCFAGMFLVLGMRFLIDAMCLLCTTWTICRLFWLLFLLFETLVLLCDGWLSGRILDRENPLEHMD